MSSQAPLESDHPDFGSAVIALEHFPVLTFLIPAEPLCKIAPANRANLEWLVVHSLTPFLSLWPA